MKVRHKDHNLSAASTYRLIEESANYYIAVPEGNADPVVLRKELYVPVPEERWVDVTEDCNVDSSGCLKHATRYPCNDYGYRLRKVDLQNRLSDPSVAIIVEKKQDPG